MNLFKDNYPTEPGQYLFKNVNSNELDLINVVLWTARPATALCEWPTYLAVSNLRNQPLKELKGYFSEKLKFHCFEDQNSSDKLRK